MAKYRKKPVVIEAVQWNGEPNLWSDREKNKLIIDEYEEGNILIKSNEELKVITKEGTMTANKGDYIIKGVQGEVYPCKPDIFEETYDIVVEA